MTRDEILDLYEVNVRGIIQSPGKFEGEMVYAPHFWEVTGDGSCETLDWADGTTTYLAEINDEDRKEFPELGTNARFVSISESDTGFVNSELLNSTEADELREQCEADDADQEPEE